MAYYTISNYLHKDLYGQIPSELNIRHDDIDDEFFNYVFGVSDDNRSKIETKVLDVLRGEFNYFYPFDLRCSGKDLIKNHLTFCLYNHLVIFG